MAVPARRCAAAVLVLAGLAATPDAWAARFTTDLDAVEAEIASRNGELPEVLSKEEKKRKAAYGKALAALAGDTASLFEELKLAGKVSKLLEKALPEDGEMDDLLDAAVDALEAKTGTALEEFEGEVEGEPDSKGKVKADRSLEIAFELLDGSVVQDTASLRLKFLQKAIQKTKPVAKFLAAPPPGGGAACGFGARALGAGESCTATYAPSNFTASSVTTQFQSSPGFQARATFHRCAGGLLEQFMIYLFTPPAVGTPYNYYDGFPLGVIYGSGEEDGLIQTQSGSGTITFTEADAATGTYAGTFTFTGGGIVVTEASFRVTGLK